MLSIFSLNGSTSNSISTLSISMAAIKSSVGRTFCKRALGVVTTSVGPPFERVYSTSILDATISVWGDCSSNGRSSQEGKKRALSFPRKKDASATNRSPSSLVGVMTSNGLPLFRRSAAAMKALITGRWVESRKLSPVLRTAISFSRRSDRAV